MLLEERARPRVDGTRSTTVIHLQRQEKEAGKNLEMDYLHAADF